MASRKDADLLWARKLRKRGDVATSRAMLEAGPASKDSHLRAYLVRTLGLASDAETRDMLCTYLLNDPEGVVRSMSAQALGQVGSSWAVPALTKALTDRERWVREAAALALGAIGDPRAVRPLCIALEEDDYSMVRAAAADALGKIGDPAATGSLIAALNDERLMVRRDAVRALPRVGGGDEVRLALESMTHSFANLLIWPSVRKAIRRLS